MKHRIYMRGIRSLLILPVITSSLSFAAPQTLNYTYDELGRLTYVDDNVNGDRDYDYDKSGNRTVVATGVTSDDQVDGDNPAPPPPQLSAPSNLSQQGPFSPYGGYHASWKSVSGATQYVLQYSDGKTLTTSNTYADSAGPKFILVYAKNSSGNGPKAYF